MNIYVHPSGTEKTIKNMYIGEYPPRRQPGVNTVAYFPFTDDVLDHSGNGVSLTNTQYFTKDTVGYTWSRSQGTSGSYIAVGFTNSTVNYISVWYKVNSATGISIISVLDKNGTYYYLSHNNSAFSNKITTFLDSSYNSVTTPGMSFNEWHHVSVGYDGTNIKISKDGVQTTLYNGAGFSLGNTVYLCGIGSNGNENITLGETICETQCWTAEEIADYYNYTKGNYGIS